ncbi:isopentenyl-diphosphate Delta-isomerase [Spirosoma oryzicola]|uniref:isopentenyl-diphosphate Delta-isomerase n=1 Tax=Spirosoma oryzicola TaxID=2898794 RepID=UPI001E34561F|nr:isopentenyl-diphosphate Delta-isomerase [Spirosoma oryzicola]UHG90532.1 isopentenyl-diphosphate Delta-isomerase [Spirosoma oryzicola]
MTNTPASPTVLLVNEQDNVLGTAEKLSVHESGDLHRAFSVLVFNEQGDYLLQQRAFEKYHSGGLWSNSCCGHPSQPDNTAAQANQRLYEEMGFRTDLQPLFSFQYHAQLPNGLTEHELDHVFTGQYEGPVPFNPDEVYAVRWVTPDALAREIEAAPETFSVWFRMLFERLQKSA